MDYTDLTALAPLIVTALTVVVVLLVLSVRRHHRLVAGLALALSACTRSAPTTGANAVNEKAIAAAEAARPHTGRTVKHYGLTNQMEYFAECTEAYLGVNDFYPFVRAELNEHDPGMFQLLKKIWGEVK